MFWVLALRTVRSKYFVLFGFFVVGNFAVFGYFVALGYFGTWNRSIKLLSLVASRYGGACCVALLSSATSRTPAASSLCASRRWAEADSERASSACTYASRR